MGDAATTVGSIEGKLGLDISDWVHKIDQAKVKARELEGSDPNVRVTVDGTDKAVAELEAVKVAEDHVADSTRKVSAAQKDGQKQAVDWRGALVGGLVAVSAAAPPVAAAALGITAAFGVMAGAGVLGIMGIVRGLQEGNAVGQEYRSTVDSLTASLHSAQDAGAEGLFPGVAESAALLRQDLPVINGEVDHFAGMLGAMLPTGLDATVTLIERANPLLDAAGAYLGSLIQDLDNWSHSNGYQQFLDYSLQSLPQVEKFLGDTGHLVIDFLQAWSQVGTETLPLLDGIVTGVDDIVKHTGPLVPAVVVAVGAFNLLKPFIGVTKGIAAGIRTMGDEAVTTAGKVAVLDAAERGGGAPGARGLGRAGSPGALLGTPMALDGTTLGIGTGGAIGLGAAAGGIAALGLGSVVLANALAPQAVSADQLASGNATAAYDALVHPENLRGRGGTNAQSSAGMLHQFAQNGGQGGFVNGFSGFMGGQTGTQIDNLDTAIASLTSSGKGAQAAAIIKKLGVSASDAAIDFPKYTAAVAAAGKADAGAAGSTKSLSEALTAQTPITATLTAAQKAQVMELRQVAEGFRSGMAAAELLGNSYDDVTIAQGNLIASFQQQAKASKDGKVSLDENTLAGAQNAEEVRGAVDKIKAHADALNTDGKHAAQARAYTLEHAKSLEEQAVKAGADKGAVDRLIGSLVGVSKTRPVSKIDIQTAQAMSALEALQNKLGDLNGYTSWVYVNLAGTAADKAGRAGQVARNAGRAEGGTIGMAGGGTPWSGTVSGAGNAAADLAGMYRLANGEEVTSNLYGQADAFRPVLKAINSQQVRTMGDLAALLGGNRGPVTQKTVNLGGVHMHNPVAVDPVQAAEDASQLITAYAGYPL